MKNSNQHWVLLVSDHLVFSEFQNTTNVRIRNRSLEQLKLVLLMVRMQLKVSSEIQFFNPILFNRKLTGSEPEVKKYLPLFWSLFYYCYYDLIAIQRSSTLLYGKEDKNATPSEDGLNLFHLYQWDCTLWLYAEIFQLGFWILLEVIDLHVRCGNIFNCKTFHSMINYMRYNYLINVIYILILIYKIRIRWVKMVS